MWKDRVGEKDLRIITIYLLGKTLTVRFLDDLGREHPERTSDLNPIRKSSKGFRRINSHKDERKVR